MSMQLDIRTLLVAIALATAFSAGARILLWRMHPGIPGIGRWAAAAGIGALALLLIATRGALPDWLALSLPQFLIAIGFTLSWDGYRRFVGCTPLPAAVWLAVALGSFGSAVLAQSGGSLLLRSWSNALVIGAVSAMIAYDVVSGARPNQIARRVTGWIYAANACFFLVRAYFAATAAEVAGPLNPDGLAAVPSLWWLCFTVAVTLGMALMIGERLQEDLDRQASCDPLTGALNRRAFAVQAEREVSRARRKGHPLTVLMMDLDHFKAVNDKLGHSAGDQILCRFVSAAEQVLRLDDTFCRFGGEEFVALLPDTGASEALTVAERLRAVYEQHTQTFLSDAGHPEFKATVSIGIGQLLSGEKVISSAIQRADEALYQAKTMGRNRCELAACPVG